MTHGAAGANRAWLALAIVGLTVAAFVLRHTGVRAFQPHPDERVYLTQVQLLRAGDPHPERTQNFRYYPLLVARIALLTQPAREAEPTTVAEHVEAAGSDGVHLRTIIALLAALGVPATYALARRFLARGWSLLAAALFAASPLAILFAQQARPHAALVAPLLAAVLACLLVRRRPVLSSYALAGIAIGGALAILHSGAAAVPALVVAHVLRDRAQARRAWIGLCLALLLASLIAFATYPGGRQIFEARPDSDGEQLAGLSGHTVFLDHFGGLGFASLARALVDYEPWLALLAAAGAAIWIVRHRRARDLLRVRGREDLIVVAAWCLPYALVIGLYDFTYERFVVPLVPCAAIAAAYAAASSSGWLAARVAGRATAAALAGTLVLVPQAFLAVRLARAYGATDTLTRCAQWIRANIPPLSARCAVFHTIDLPLLRTEASLRENPRQLFEATRRPWLVYQAGLAPDPLAAERYELVTVPLGNQSDPALFQADLARSIASWQADYVILEVRARSRFDVDRMRALLQATATRVARFSPYSDPEQDRPFWYEHPPEYGWWTAHLLQARGLGPVVEVYRLR